MSRFGSHQGGGRRSAHPVLLRHPPPDGRDLIDEPLDVRIELLERVVPAGYRVPRVVTASARVAEAASPKPGGTATKA